LFVYLTGGFLRFLVIIYPFGSRHLRFNIIVVVYKCRLRLLVWGYPYLFRLGWWRRRVLTLLFLAFGDLAQEFLKAHRRKAFGFLARALINVPGRGPDLLLLLAITLLYRLADHINDSDYDIKPELKIIHARQIYQNLFTTAPGPRKPH